MSPFSQDKCKGLFIISDLKNNIADKGQNLRSLSKTDSRRLQIQVPVNRSKMFMAAKTNREQATIMEDNNLDDDFTISTQMKQRIKKRRETIKSFKYLRLIGDKLRR